MSDQFVGEIRWFPYMRGAPSGWLACDGSNLQISDYQVLFNLIGTTYGGDGNTNFSLPDLRGRVPVHQGAGQGLTPRPIGSNGGGETASVGTTQLPTHTHAFQATSNTANNTSPGQAVLASMPAGVTFYLDDLTNTSPLSPSPQMFGMTGQNVAHENCAPTLPLLACIATEGQYPVRPS